MLTHISVNNIVLIKQLNLDFTKGMSVFTGETGSGKSVLIDALSLTLGSKSNSKLLADNVDKGHVSATFNLHNSKFDELKQYLNDLDIISNDELILRRVISKNSGSKAFVNDTPVNIQTLKNISTYLVDIHGQFDNQQIMQKSYHRSILDKFGLHSTLCNKVKEYFRLYKEALNKHEDYQKQLTKLEDEKGYLEYIYQELKDVDPKNNEDKELILKRNKYKNAQNNKKLLTNVYTHIQQQLAETTNTFNAAYKAEQLLAEEQHAAIIEQLTTAENALLATNSIIETEIDALDSLSENELEIIEERLATLNDLSRKHRCSVDELSNMVGVIEEKLNSVEEISSKIVEIEKEGQEHLQNFQRYAEELSKQRAKSAKKLSKLIHIELKELQLSHAQFNIAIERIADTNNYNEFGMDRVTFQVRTNNRGDFYALHQVASGGELARIMLALKVVLATFDYPNTIVFDEIDIGVGGEVASAIGKCMYRLAQDMQVIVVTHSHQVAAVGNNHYLVSKSHKANNLVNTNIEQLNMKQSINEIARMLSGDTVTPETLEAAASLVKHKQLS